MNNHHTLTPDRCRPLHGGRYECAVDSWGRMDWVDAQCPDRILTLIDVLADRRVDPTQAVAVHMGALFDGLVDTYDWALMMENHALALHAGDTPNDGVIGPPEDLAAALSWMAESLQQPLDDLAGVITGLCASGPGGDWPFEPTEAWRGAHGDPTLLDLTQLVLPPDVLVGVAAQMARTVTVAAQLRRSLQLMTCAVEQRTQPG